MTNGEHSDISRVLILGVSDIHTAKGCHCANFDEENNTRSSIAKALVAANLEVHVSHPRKPVTPDENVTYHLSDADKDESLRSLLPKVSPDLVISTISGGAFETQKAIIDNVCNAGISRFVANEFGQDTMNGKIQDRLPPTREKARTIEYLKALSQADKITWAAVATGLDLERGLLSGNLGFDLKWQSATLNGKGHERFAASSTAWVGQAVLEVIRHWKDVKNQYLYAAGMTTTANDTVISLEKFTGKEFEVGRGDVEDCAREAEKRMEQGFPDASMFLMGRVVMYDESIGGVKPFLDDDAKLKLGLKGETLDDVVKRVVHKHEHHGGKADCGCE